MKASELIVKCLANEGVGYIFGIPGEENLDVVDALADSSVRFVTTRHEQGAAFMADVYGRLTGEAGVCLATLGPGATNLLTGVADSNLDRAPLVALTGQVSSDRMHKESHQYVDVVSLFRPVTKWNTSMRIPEVIPEAIRKAFKVAQTEKPGATHIEIPEDIAKAEIEAIPLLAQSPHPGPALTGQIERAAHLIAQAQQPVILAGNGVIRARACEALVQFAERLNIPVATTFMGKGVISDRHPLAHGAIGLQARDYLNRAFAQADMVITVGYDLVEFAPSFWNLRHDRQLSMWTHLRLKWTLPTSSASAWWANFQPPCANWRGSAPPGRKHNVRTCGELCRTNSISTAMTLPFPSNHKGSSRICAGR